MDASTKFKQGMPIEDKDDISADIDDTDKLTHLTRKKVISIIKGFYEDNFIHREYLVQLLQEGKKMFGSLEKLYDVPIPTGDVMSNKDSDNTRTKVTVSEQYIYPDFNWFVVF